MNAIEILHHYATTDRLPITFPRLPEHSGGRRYSISHAHAPEIRLASAHSRQTPIERQPFTPPTPERKKRKNRLKTVFRQVGKGASWLGHKIVMGPMEYFEQRRFKRMLKNPERHERQIHTEMVRLYEKATPSNFDRLISKSQLALYAFTHLAIIGNVLIPLFYNVPNIIQAAKERRFVKGPFYTALLAADVALAIGLIHHIPLLIFFTVFPGTLAATNSFHYELAFRPLQRKFNKDIIANIADAIDHPQSYDPARITSLRTIVENTKFRNTTEKLADSRRKTYKQIVHEDRRIAVHERRLEKDKKRRIVGKLPQAYNSLWKIAHNHIRHGQEDIIDAIDTFTQLTNYHHS